MKISDYQAWVDDLQNAPRGMQRWDARVKIYEAISANPELLSNSLPTFCEETGTAQSTFYAYFRGNPKQKLWDIFDENSKDAVEPALAETKAWSICPYLDGALSELDALHAGISVKVEALARTVAEWAADNPHLALAQTMTPLVPLEGTIKQLFSQDNDGSTAQQFIDIFKKIIISAASNSDATSLTTLNIYRAQIHQLLTMEEEIDPVQEFITALARYMDLTLNNETTEEQDFEVANHMNQALIYFKGNNGSSH